jgi:hypothetical protein
MHDWGDLASNALVADFRTAEPAVAAPHSPGLKEKSRQRSKGYQMERGSIDHDAGASNQGRCS